MSYNLHFVSIIIYCGLAKQFRLTGTTVPKKATRKTPPQLLASHVQVHGAVNWNKSLNEIEAKPQSIGKRDHSAAEEQWAAEAASHFYGIKKPGAITSCMAFMNGCLAAGR